MATVHPHAEATYRVLPRDDGSFAVEVSIPGTNPTKVTGIESQEAAEAWITRHKESVATGTILRRPTWARRTRP